MKRLTLLLTCLCLSIITAKPAASQPTAASKNVDAAIRAIADDYVKASLAGDAKAIAALYTEDAVEMPPNAPAVKGRVAIEQYYAKVLKSAKLSVFTLNHLETRAVGDTGYDVGTYQQTVTPTGGAAMDDTGKYAVILKRSGGAWRVAYAIYNSDRPAPPPRCG
jgi:uncharacterized protein (TIGR02246 family)